MVPPCAPRARSEFKPSTTIEETMGEATVSTSSAKPLGLLLRTVSWVGCATSMKPRRKSALEIANSAGADLISMFATARTVTLTEKSEGTPRAPPAVTLAGATHAIRAVARPLWCEELLKSLNSGKSGRFFRIAERPEDEFSDIT